MKNRKAEPGLRLINMENVAVEQVEWLLYPFIPYGKVTIIQGDPGEGKTTMVLQIIAKLTKGRACAAGKGRRRRTHRKGRRASQCDLPDRRRRAGRYYKAPSSGGRGQTVLKCLSLMTVNSR